MPNYGYLVACTRGHGYLVASTRGQGYLLACTRGHGYLLACTRGHPMHLQHVGKLFATIQAKILQINSTSMCMYVLVLYTVIKPGIFCVSEFLLI